MIDTPCAHLIEVSHIDGEPRCDLGRGFPDACPTCAAYSPGLTDQERTRCEVWTRVMGYHRPTHAFNPGKQSEHNDRKYFVDRPGDLEPSDG
jgi:anaerobic ribonucleoside-triphosphate reductase